MVKKRQVHQAYILTTAPQRVVMDNNARSGLITQSQSTNTGNIYLSSGGSYNDNECLQLTPSGILYEDILSPTSDLWARSTVAGDVLTVVEKYVI